MRRNAFPPTGDNLPRELAKLLRHELIPDLRKSARQGDGRQELVARHQRDREAGYTSTSYEEWLGEFVEQTGACWILACVFVHLLEDSGLIARETLGKVASSGDAAKGLRATFRELARSPGVEPILGERWNALWRLPLSAGGAGALLSFFRERDADGLPRWNSERSALLLESLYGELSWPLREQHALLSTPSFVVDFILERTLEPAIAESGLDEVSPPYSRRLAQDMHRG